MTTDKQPNGQDHVSPEHTQHNDDAPAAVVQPVPADDYVIEEYEQLKRKNRQRLVAAGALVLVAGGLFAAASQQTPPPAPALSATAPADRAPAVTTDILLPGNGRASAPVINVDDSQNAPIKLSRKIQAAAPLSPEEKAALEARQQRAKAQRLAQQRKLEAERAEREGKNPTKPAPETAVAVKESTKPQKTAADRSKEREEEQRRRKAQALSAKAEAERTAKERAAADKAREAQLAADKKRASERAKLETQKKSQQSSDKDKLAADKQREKSRTAEREKTAAKPAATAANTTTKSGNGRVSIQAGAFADKAHAQKVQQQLKSLNYSSHLEEVQTAKGTVYRVKTGKFANQNEAKNAIERIKGKGMNGVVVNGQ